MTAPQIVLRLADSPELVATPANCSARTPSPSARISSIKGSARNSLHSLPLCPAQWRTAHPLSSVGIRRDPPYNDKHLPGTRFYALKLAT
jgi:hypothetical protein